MTTTGNTTTGSTSTVSPHLLHTLREQLLSLRQLHASGALDQAAYDQARQPLEQALVNAVLDGSTVIPAQQPATAQPISQSSGVPKRLTAALVAGVLLVGGAGFWWQSQRSPEWSGEAAGMDSAGGAGTDNASATAAPHEVSNDAVAAMVAKLANRLKEHPKDPEGWAMLARSYSVLQRFDEAVKAYQQALQQHGDDAALLADYADALAMTQGGRIDGEPIKLVQRALKLDPNYPKAQQLQQAWKDQQPAKP